jgi:hypothetical protein
MTLASSALLITQAVHVKAVRTEEDSRVADIKAGLGAAHPKVQD